MLRLVQLAAIFAASLSSTAASLPSDHSASFTRVNALKAFSFDAPDGTYSAQNVPLDCGTDAIWLKAHFTRLGTPKTKWAPLISLTIESSTTSATVRVLPENFEAPLDVEIVTVDLNAQTDVSQVVLYNKFGLDASVPVLASWSSDGLVTFNIGGETRVVHLKGPVLQASLTGCTGAGVFDPVEIGRISGTDPAVSCPTPSQ